MGREAVRSHGLGVALNKSKQQLGRFVLTSVAVAALALGAVDSWAVGLGRLSVQSNLGETLRAEIDITSLTPEEAANLKVHVASPDAYRAAGVDYNVVLPSTQAALLRRADGHSAEQVAKAKDTLLHLAATLMAPDRSTQSQGSHTQLHVSLSVSCWSLGCA